jgi:hypothetical protein
LNRALFLFRLTIQGIPTFNSTPLPLDLIKPSGTALSLAKVAGSSRLGGGSKAEAGCNLDECVEAELAFLPPRVAVGAGGGGIGLDTLIGEDVVAVSEPDDPSLWIIGSRLRCGSR